MHINMPKHFVSMVLLVAKQLIHCLSSMFTPIECHAVHDTTQYMNCQILNNKSTDI